MKIAYIIEARPNIVKMAPVIGELRRRLPRGRPILDHSGQLYHPDLAGVFFDEAVENLRAEGISDERMHFVGNTMIDSLVTMEDRFRALDAAGRLGVRPGGYLLVTLHRPSLVDGQLLPEVLERLNDVARELP